MTLFLDTAQVPVRDRVDAVRETIAERVVHVEIQYPLEREPASVAGAISDLGGLTVCSIRSNAVTVERTPTLARDDMPPGIFLGLQLAGTSLIVQDGREAVLRPGDLAFSESTSPYTLADSEGIRQHFFAIPTAELALPLDLVKRLSATLLSPGHPLADLTATYLRRLARPENAAHPAVHTLGAPSIELVRALLATHVDASHLAAGPLSATLSRRIIEYLRSHLADPGLDVAQVAAAHHISVRHLYSVLARDGISPGQWIRKHRLERCRDELSDPGARDLTISAIAHRWGFRDASAFGRLFRSEYGLSPREWRHLSSASSPGQVSRDRPP